MIYSEAAYFDGVPVAHCAAWDEHNRLQRIARQARMKAFNARFDRRRDKGVVQ